MRCFIIISFTMLFMACGNRLNNLKYTGEKVAQTVEACTDVVTEVCNEEKKISSVSTEYDQQGGADDKVSASWDMRMMLW